jgi:hypothetical protein
MKSWGISFNVLTRMDDRGIRFDSKRGATISLQIVVFWVVTEGDTHVLEEYEATIFRV